MKVLLTGAFGNIGRSTIDELLSQGHEIRCFDVKTPANEKSARAYQGRLEVVWGDIRKPEEVAAAMEGRDAVIHLAFIIPSTMSLTGKSSEDHPEWAEAINVGGAKNVIAAAKDSAAPPRLVFASSLSLYGVWDGVLEEKTADHPVMATDNYSAHKLECEGLVRESGLDWIILRFAAVPAVAVGMNNEMFSIPLDNPIEFIHTKDVGLACANASGCQEAVGKTLLIGGGKKCQMLYGDMIGTALEAFGLGRLPEEAFSKERGYFHWLDTTESQQLLQYQRHTYEDWVEDVKKEMGVLRHLARATKPIARWVVLRGSPHYKKGAKS